MIKKLWWFWLLSGVVALFALGRWLRTEGAIRSSVPVSLSAPVGSKASHGVDSRERAKEHLSTEKRKLRADVQDRLGKCQDAIKGHYDSFLDGIDSYESNKCFQDAREGVDFICSGEGLCGWKVCAVLAYKMAVDKVKGTDYAEQAVVPLMNERVFNALGEGLQCREALLAQYRRRIREEVEDFSADCCLRMKDYEACAADAAMLLDPETMKREGESYSQIENSIRDLAVGRMNMFGGAVLTAAFAKSSYTSIRKCLMRVIAKYFARIVARNIASATIACTASIADGPLPIGDIVGGALEIGGLTWTGWEIYSVTKKMPDALRSQLTEAVDKAQKESLKSCRAQARKDMMHALSECDESVAELLKGGLK